MSAELTDQKNPHDYVLDSNGCPVCQGCGHATNPAYAVVPNLQCWCCGHRSFLPIYKPKITVSVEETSAKLARLRELLGDLRAVRKRSAYGEHCESGGISPEQVAELRKILGLAELREILGIDSTKEQA